MDTRALIPFDDYLAQIETAVNFLNKRTSNFLPKILIICGSGLGGISDLLLDQTTIPYDEIPNFPVPTVSGHAGKLVFGISHGKKVVCMVGRLHAYEGYSSQKLTFPVRVMQRLGVELVIVTNASGGLNPLFRSGDIMIIKDHFSIPGLSGQSPLMGPNDERLGPRFTPMTDPYEKEYIRLAHKVAMEKKLTFVRIGIYAHVAGPAYETRSEARMLRTLGGDAVGMSTVPEVVVARHGGMKVLGLSLITNLVAIEEQDDFITTHADVLMTSSKRAHAFQTYLDDILFELQI